MTKRSKKKRAEIPTARTKTERVLVSSPTVPGAREEVEYVPDVVEHMRARRQLGKTRAENEFAYRAADRIRRAHETLHGGVGGVMDFDRVRGPGCASTGPHQGYLLAAETMRDVRTYLYPADQRVVELCICGSYTIDQAASIICRRAVTRTDRDEISRCLRHALQALAERWFGTGGDPSMSKRKIRTWSDPANETTPVVAGVVSVGGAYVSRGSG